MSIKEANRNGESIETCTKNKNAFYGFFTAYKSKLKRLSQHKRRSAEEKASGRETISNGVTAGWNKKRRERLSMGWYYRNHGTCPLGGLWRLSTGLYYRGL